MQMLGQEKGNRVVKSVQLRNMILNVQNNSSAVRFMGTSLLLDHMAFPLIAPRLVNNLVGFA